MKISLYQSKEVISLVKLSLIISIISLILSIALVSAIYCDIALTYGIYITSKKTFYQFISYILFSTFIIGLIYVHMYLLIIEALKI